MIFWIDAITDRTQADVDRVLELLNKDYNDFSSDEKVEFASGLKGALNNSDLVRITNNIQLLSDVLELNLDVAEITSLPRKSFYESLLNNVESIRSNAPILHQSTPATPTHPINTYKKWNDVEQILLDIYEILHNNFFIYCGESEYAGSTLL